MPAETSPDSLTSSQGLAPGTVRGRFEIVREIASGGFGTVYEARHLHTQVRVALKVLHDHVADNDVNRARFLREIRAPAAVDHPSMVEVLDAAVETGGQPWVAMEWLDGHTLRELPPTSLAELLGMYDEILMGLMAAHRAGVVHRDLKPDNIFVEALAGDGRQIRILDFGLAREQGSSSITEVGMALGTPRYMSPEQFMDARAAGPSTDVWAIGVMLYEVVAGRPPFSATKPHALMLKVLTEPPTPLRGAPAPLVAIIERCMRKEPSERFPDASSLLEALRTLPSQLSPEMLAMNLPVAEVPPSVTAPARPGARRSLPTDREVSAASVAPIPPTPDHAQLAENDVSVLMSGASELASAPLGAPLAPSAAPATEPDSAPHPHPSSAPPSGTARPRRRWLLGVLIGASVLVVGGVCGSALLFAGLGRPAVDAGSATPAPPTAPPDSSTPPMIPGVGPALEPLPSSELATEEEPPETPADAGTRTRSTTGRVRSPSRSRRTASSTAQTSSESTGEESSETPGDDEASGGIHRSFGLESLRRPLDLLP